MVPIVEGGVGVDSHSVSWRANEERNITHASVFFCTVVIFMCDSCVRIPGGSKFYYWSRLRRRLQQLIQRYASCLTGELDSLE